MILLIDWGNTLLKYIQIESLNINLIDKAEVMSVVDIEQLKKRLKGNYSNVLICSVRSEQDNILLHKMLKEKCEHLFCAKTSHKACGIQCAYSEPELLGVDRWLAVIAASDRREKTAVVSIGTAITLDLIENDKHLGGHIVPGKKLLFESLFSTDRVRPISLSAPDDLFALGHSTTECVTDGVETLVFCYLSSILKHYKEELQVTRWIFSGGGGLYWVDKLSSEACQIVFSSHLIFKGLAKLYLDSTD